MTKTGGSGEPKVQAVPGAGRREFIKSAGRLLVATAAVSGGLIKPELVFPEIKKSREINIGTFGPSHCATPFVYARLQGFFAGDGLQVNLVNYPTMPLIAKDLISGKLDFGQLIVPLVFAIHTGSGNFTRATPMVISQITGTNGAALMVRKGAGIAAPDDFRGKTMANHSKLSVHYLINMIFLENYGLSYEKDVRFQVIELDRIVDAMKAGEVDTFVMPEPKDAITELKGIGDVFMLSKYIWPSHPCCALVTRKEFHEANPALVTDVTRSMTRAALLANKAESREQTIDILQSSPDYKYDKAPKAALMRAFTPGRSDFYPFPFQSTARLIIEIMQRYRLLPVEVKAAELGRQVFLSDLSRQVMKEVGVTPPASDFREEKILGKVKLYDA